MKNLKVSILVPVYGVEKYIERCAHSLFSQTYKDLEYIFVDDCSPDKSVEKLEYVIKEYPNRKDQVFIIHHDKNLGLAAARNTGIANANGEFILHVDSDDYIEKDTVEKCIAKQMENDADIVSFGCYREYRSKTVVQLPPCFLDSKNMCLSLIAKKFNNKLINVGIWGRLIRRSLYIDNDIRTEVGVNMAEDYQVISRLAYYSDVIATLQEPLTHYNLHNETSYVNRKTEKSIYQSERSFQIVYDFFIDKGAEFVDVLNSSLASLVVRWIIDSLDCNLGIEIYDKMLNRWNDIPMKYRRDISISRFPLFINYKIAKAYLIFVRSLKKGI